MRRKNVGTVERVLRVGVGGGFALWALLSLLEGGGLMWLLLHVAIVALGVAFVVTGIRGYCPLYNWLRWNTTQPQHG
jgi:hypothetical protein